MRIGATVYNFQQSIAVYNEGLNAKNSKLSCYDQGRVVVFMEKLQTKYNKEGLIKLKIEMHKNSVQITSYEIMKNAIDPASATLDQRATQFNVSDKTKKHQEIFIELLSRLSKINKAREPVYKEIESIYFSNNKHKSGKIIFKRYDMHKKISHINSLTYRCAKKLDRYLKFYRFSYDLYKESVKDSHERITSEVKKDLKNSQNALNTAVNVFCNELTADKNGGGKLLEAYNAHFLKIMALEVRIHAAKRFLELKFTPPT